MFWPFIIACQAFVVWLAVGICFFLHPYQPPPPTTTEPKVSLPEDVLKYIHENLVPLGVWSPRDLLMWHSTRRSFYREWCNDEKFFAMVEEAISMTKRLEKTVIHTSLYNLQRMQWKLLDIRRLASAALENRTEGDDAKYDNVGRPLCLDGLRVATIRDYLAAKLNQPDTVGKKLEDCLNCSDHYIVYYASRWLKERTGYCLYRHQQLNEELNWNSVMNLKYSDKLGIRCENTRIEKLMPQSL
jgi:hypothetical protein